MIEVGRVAQTKLVVYNCGMTTTMMPKPRLDKQQIAVANIKLLLDASHSKKKDLAEYLGKVPQSLSKMLQNKQTWFFEDMCTAAEFFGVGIETLVRTDLTPLKAEQILKTAAPNGNDGQLVAGHGFEPWTSGYPRGPRSKPMPRLILSLAA